MTTELERLRHWKAEATTLFDGLQDLGRALGLPLGTLITGPDAVEAAVGLRGEVARLRAQVARVEALAEEWEHRYDAGDHMLGCPDGAGYYDLLADEARAALADESAQDGLSRAGTASVASGATGDVEGAQIGAQDEGGKA